MKRFMILILVLGMAPMAGAEISFVSTSAWVGNSQTVTIQVSSDTSGVAWAGYIGYTHANVSITTSDLTPNYVPTLIRELSIFFVLQSARRSVAEPGGLQLAAKAPGGI